MTRRQAVSLALVLAGIDQTIKWLVVFGLGYQTGESQALLPFLDIRLLWNPGISYGLFDTAGATGQWLLFVFGSLITLGFIWALGAASTRMTSMAYGLIIGGAVGNLVDRLLHGAVVDFISFHAAGYYWYVFNIADIWITFGVGLLIIDILFGSEKPEK